MSCPNPPYDQWIIPAPLIIVVSHSFMISGVNNSRESIPDPYEIKPKSEDILTSGQDITQCAALPYVDKLDLLGYTILREHDDTDQHSEVKEFLEDEGKSIL